MCLSGTPRACLQSCLLAGSQSAPVNFPVQVTVAKKMEERGLKLPLLIGGATTSKMHTAVKIEPQFNGPVVYVLDASRSVPVVQSLLDPKQKDEFIEDVRCVGGWGEGGGLHMQSADQVCAIQCGAG